MPWTADQIPRKFAEAQHDWDWAFWGAMIIKREVPHKTIIVMFDLLTSKTLISLWKYTNFWCQYVRLYNFSVGKSSIHFWLLNFTWPMQHLWRLSLRQATSCYITELQFLQTCGVTTLIAKRLNRQELDAAIQDRYRENALWSPTKSASSHDVTDFTVEPRWVI